MKIQFWNTDKGFFLANEGTYYIQLIDDKATLVSKIIIEINNDEYPRYKEYCKGKLFAKIIRVETYPNYVGKGYATKLMNFLIKKFKYYIFFYYVALVKEKKIQIHLRQYLI